MKDLVALEKTLLIRPFNTPHHLDHTNSLKQQNKKPKQLDTINIIIT